VTTTRRGDSGAEGKSSANRSSPARAPEFTLAAMHGGWVTRERLEGAAARAGRTAAPVLRELLERQAPPSFADLARQCATAFAPLRLDAAHVVLAPRAAHILDMEMLRRHRAVPIQILDELCVLAVMEGRAESAVRAVRAALQRDVLPVFASREAVDCALDTLVSPRKAVRRGPIRRHDSTVHARFRELVLEKEIFDALPRGELPARRRGFSPTPAAESNEASTPKPKVRGP
jgi:hypothetical protein